MTPLENHLQADRDMWKKRCEDLMDKNDNLRQRLMVALSNVNMWYENYGRSRREELEAARVRALEEAVSVCDRVRKELTHAELTPAEEGFSRVVCTRIANAIRTLAERVPR